MRCQPIIAVLVLALVTGCQQPAKKPTASDTGKRQWNSTRGAVLANLANDQFHNGDFERARQSINEALRMDNESAPIRIISARIAIEQSQLELAEKDLKLARQFDPKNPEADFLSGVVYQRWQKPEVAYEFYNHATEKAPAELSYLMARAEMLVAMDRAPEALKMLEEKVIYFEHSATIRDAVGQLLVGQKKYVAAAEALKQASVLAPDDLSVREHLGMALFYSRQYGDAASLFERLIKSERYTKRSDLLATLGECQCELGKFREARDSFDAASKLDPSTAGIWLGLGKAALELGDFHRADLSLKKALAMDPQGSEANLMLGYLRLRQDKLPEALAAFKKVNASDNADTLGLCMTGYVLQKLGKPDEAIQYYGKALKRNPTDELAAKLMAGIELRE